MNIVEIKTLKTGDRISWSTGPYVVTKIEKLKRRNNHQLHAYYNLEVHHEILLQTFVMKLKGTSICELVEVAQ